MLMIYGLFVFELKTISYQSFDESNARFNSRDALQFTGIESETISLNGTLYPEITGGRISLELFRRQADLGAGLPLINGSGLLLGFYVVETLQSTKSEFFKDGAARKIEFTVSLKKTDPPQILTTGKFSKLSKLLKLL